jgi:Circularly permutated YpsA SLOG family
VIGARMTGASSGPIVVRIVSGGQTGVDRAALDVAIRLGIPCGGWVPRGRRAEDGPVPCRYPMQETKSRAYAPRTQRNVEDSDATLILCRGRPSGGTALTVACAAVLGRPHRIVDLQGASVPADIRKWLCDNAIGVLNVGGPRESTSPGVYGEAVAFLDAVLRGQPARQ